MARVNNRILLYMLAGCMLLLKFSFSFKMSLQKLYDVCANLVCEGHSEEEKEFARCSTAEMYARELTGIGYPPGPWRTASICRMCAFVE